MPTETKTLWLPPHAARRAASLKAGERLLIVEPVVPPIDEEGLQRVYRQPGEPERNLWVFDYREAPESSGWKRFRRFSLGQPGDVVTGRSEQHWGYRGKDGLGNEISGSLSDEPLVFVYPLRIAALDVRQIGSVTEEEAEACGMTGKRVKMSDTDWEGQSAKQSWIEDWNARHPGHWPSGWCWFVWLEKEGIG